MKKLQITSKKPMGNLFDAYCEDLYRRGDIDFKVGMLHGKSNDSELVNSLLVDMMFLGAYIAKTNPELFSISKAKTIKVEKPSYFG